MTNSIWTNEPLPTGYILLEDSWYFFAELHKGEWLVSLNTIVRPTEYKAYTDYWKRSRQSVEFPKPPFQEIDNHE